MAPSTDERLMRLETKQDAHHEALDALRDEMKEGLAGIRQELKDGLQSVSGALATISERDERQEGRLLAIEVKQAGMSMKIKSLWAAAGSLLVLLGGFVWRMLAG